MDTCFSGDKREFLLFFIGVENDNSFFRMIVLIFPRVICACRRNFSENFLRKNNMMDSYAFVRAAHIFYRSLYYEKFSSLSLLVLLTFRGRQNAECRLYHSLMSTSRSHYPIRMSYEWEIHTCADELVLERVYDLSGAEAMKKTSRRGGESFQRKVMLF